MILRREEPAGTFDRLSLSVAMVAAIRAVASTRPVLVAVDDAQWLDHPTARTLAYAVRRLAGTAVRIALVRSEGGWSAPAERRAGRPAAGAQVVDWLAELARAMPAGRFDTVRLGPDCSE